jgi:hypothetical protein
MLQKLGEHIADALERAAAADQRTRNASDRQLRLDNELMADSWRLLAHSFQSVESLKQFLIDPQKGRNVPPPKPPKKDPCEW